MMQQQFSRKSIRRSAGARSTGAAFTKIRSRFDRGEKFIDVINQFRREPDTDRIADYGEQSFARPRIIEPLDCRSQSVLRDADTDLPGRDLFDCMRFVQNDEIIWKKKSAFALFLLVW